MIASYIPRLFKLRGRWWTVYVEPETSAHRRKQTKKTLKAQGLLGICYTGAREIHLRGSLVKYPRRLREIFWHEVIHAMLPTDAEWLGGDDVEEALCNRIAPRLTAILRDMKGMGFTL